MSHTDVLGAPCCDTCGLPTTPPPAARTKSWAAWCGDAPDPVCGCGEAAA